MRFTGALHPPVASRLPGRLRSLADSWTQLQATGVDEGLQDWGDTVYEALREAAAEIERLRTEPRSDADA